MAAVQAEHGNDAVGRRDDQPVDEPMHRQAALVRAARIVYDERPASDDAVIRRVGPLVNGRDPKLVGTAGRAGVSRDLVEQVADLGCQPLAIAVEPVLGEVAWIGDAVDRRTQDRGDARLQGQRLGRESEYALRPPA